eukprot:gene41293-65346_t
MFFPNDEANFPWTLDNYGPLTIPQKGKAIALNQNNIALYRRLITVYEHNILEEKDGQFIINGKLVNSYTPQFNYYWMMGDNRHRSQDSRFWGFVPETHIVVLENETALSTEDAQLLIKARAATAKAYAPYSQFQ